jgi:amino-acid N-acetyltransferase
LLIIRKKEVIFLVEIRDAEKKDLNGVVHLINLGAKEGLLLKRTKKDLLSMIKEQNVIVADDNGIVVGIVILDFYSKRLSEMRSIYVLLEYRKCGLGSKLVEALKKKAKSKKVKELMTITIKGMVPWFEKFGFNEAAHDFKVALFKKI